MDNMVRLKKAWTYLVIAGVGILAALNYELFVFPNQFAPSGINGICTIIQHVFGISVGSLFMAGYLPGAVLALSLAVGTYIIAVKRTECRENMCALRHHI